MTSKIGKTIYVVKPFVFSHAGTAAVTDPATGKITTHATPGYSKEFAVGEHDTTPEMIGHPWIEAGADGAIETEEQKKERTEQESIDKLVTEQKAKVAQARADQANAKADAAAKAAAKPAAPVAAKV